MDATSTKGLEFNRYFTEGQEGKDIYDSFEWERGDINITDESGKRSFVQEGAEFPKTWSPLARKIVASKYFFGKEGISDREYSARQLIGRVSETFSGWGLRQDYFSAEQAEIFRDELAHLGLSQKMAFNSPVWFNVGIDRYPQERSKYQKQEFIIENGEVTLIPIGKDREYPQTSACFIQSVEDTMEGIMELAVNEAMLFKYGSGTGTNLSTLRSSREALSGGGKPSGPLAYWAFYDKVAGIVKSGGKTRRAAKMDIIDIDHPDILEFIRSKKEEEEKMHILMNNGIDWKAAQESVNYQNTNISIRAGDDFMRTIEEDGIWKTVPVHSHELADEMPKYKARELLREIAEGTYDCGDPGMQFDDNINRWHTCPNTEKIFASNPCSEYMFLNNSSCNLASINLMKFLNEDGTFDTDSFERTVRTTIIAQDLEFDNSSYPTEKIAENSHRFRPLGLGYANLGSLVMSLGLPYDSDEARATAGAVTALLTGKAYETSTEMAEAVGTFEGYDENKEPMLNVMRMHRDALNDIDREKLPKGLENVLDEADRTWDSVIGRGEKYGFRNAQATVLAPTGTIGFMMDCDTKGVEPEIGLVQTKLLSDGGTLKLVNGVVEPTLGKLGYDEEQINEMLEYVKEHQMIEGAQYLREEHLAIFDCSNKPENGTRTISPQGHLKMMAAVQPFLSGAISKTVNLPEDSTIEEIEQTYIDAWKMDLKSVALFRDGSKSVQPLSFSKKGSLEERAGPVRRKIPTTSQAIRHKFNISGHKGYIHPGIYEDGFPGEIFINMSKEGSTIGGLMDAFATSISFNLQYGVPLEALVKKFRHQRFEPRGIVHEGHPDIHTANSVVDYIFHFLQKEFLPNLSNGDDEDQKQDLSGEESKSGESNSNRASNNLSELGDFCLVCGEHMFKQGNCEQLCICGYRDLSGCGG